MFEYLSINLTVVTYSPFKESKSPRHNLSSKIGLIFPTFSNDIKRYKKEGSEMHAQWKDRLYSMQMLLFGVRLYFLTNDNIFENTLLSIKEKIVSSTSKFNDPKIMLDSYNLNCPSEKFSIHKWVQEINIWIEEKLSTLEL